MNHRKILLYLGYSVAFLTLFSLFLLSQATEGSQKFERFYQPLLITIAIGITCLVIIVFIYLRGLIKAYYQKIPGASLSLTILWRTLFLAFVPLIFISFFAFKFLRYEFQSSFDEGINDALNNALVLSKKSLGIRALQFLKESKEVAKTLSLYDYLGLQTQLEKIRQRFGAYELSVLDEKGFVQAFASQNLNIVAPSIPSHNDFSRAQNEGGIFALETNTARFKIRSLVTINKPGSSNYYLQSVFYIPDTVSDLASQVNKTITERDKLNYLMPRVNRSFILVLILVIMLACLLLILSSIGFAGDMSQPIRSLIQGTKRVSKGDFSQPLLIKRYDDFGTLMQSFNQMTESLESATEDANHNRERVENERAYLATVINSMTSAVITLDYQYRLQTFNLHAEKLLNSNLQLAIYHHLKMLDSSLSSYKQLINQIVMHYEKNNKRKEIEIQVNVSNQLITLVGNITPLPSTDSLHGGYVVIFDVMSEYLQQQKQAAWEEVARRLAHEIKNPLTPIQLAAERLNYKLSGHLDEKEQQVLSRSIELITNQVKALKNMVNDFSHFAKPLMKEKNLLDLNQLTKEIFDLYQGHYKNIDFYLEKCSEKSQVMGNEQMLRQVLHNLIKNAIESCEIRLTDQNYRGKVKLRTQNNKSQFILSIIDNGVGISDDGNKLFEPYVTTKEKGTGLGLAIVKKIIQEHQGKIELNAKDNERGSIAMITLPLINTDETIRHYEPTAI